MKNKFTLLALVLSLTGLVACNGDRTDDTSSASSSTENTTTSYKDADDKQSSSDDEESSSKDSSSKKNSSSSSSASTTITSLDDAFTKLANYNCTLKNTYYSIDYYGKNAYHFNNIHSAYASYTGGLVSTANDGTWYYSLDADDSDEFELDGFYSTANGELLDVSSYYTPLKTLIESKDSWERPSSSASYYTLDEEDAANDAILSALPNLARLYDGYNYSSGKVGSADSTYSYVAENVKLQIVNKKYLSFSFTSRIYISGKRDSKYWNSSFYIRNIGGNSSSGLEAFIANPSTVLTAPTGFSTAFNTASNTILGETLPFSTSFTAAGGYSLDGIATNYETAMYYIDYLTGDITTDYGTLLTGAGWTAGTKVENSSYTGTSTTPYTKGNKTVYVSYFSTPYFTAYDKEYGTTLATRYTKGQFQISATSFNGISKYINDGKITGSDGTNMFPTMDFSNYAISSATFQDLTSAANSYFSVNLSYYYYITGSFKDYNTALTALSAYAESCVSAAGGFYIYESDAGTSSYTGPAYESAREYLDNDGEVALFKDDTKYTEMDGLQFVIQLDSTKATGAFKMYIMA